MNFELSEEQKDIQKAAWEFARGEFDPDLAIELDQKGTFPDSIWEKAARLGFIGIHYPDAFGGQGLGFFENVLVIEAFCRADSGIGSALSLVDLGSEVILKFGSQDQKKKLLTPLAKGKKKLSVAFGEPEDEKDLSPISTVAERGEREYLIRGQTRFVINATSADTFLVLCKEPKEDWIVLVIERDGIEIQPIEKMGLRMVPYGNLHFKETRVPHENRLGKEGDGIHQLNFFHQVFGLRSLAQALGLIEGAFDRAAQYAKQREQFQKKLSQFQAIQHKLAEMAVGMELSRSLTYKSAIQFDRGELDRKILSIARLEVGRRLLEGVDEAVQIFGGYGYMAEQSIEHYYRDAWAVAVELGTEEENKDDIAKRILGV